METLFPWRFNEGTRTPFIGKLAGVFVSLVLNAIHLAVYVATVLAVVRYIPKYLP